MFTYSINLGVSEKIYEQKPPKDEFTNCEFSYQTLTRDELLEKILEGRIFAHNFDIKRWCNRYTHTFKRYDNQLNVNFLFANVLFIDVDDTELEFDDFIKSLTMKPSIAYTTFNHKKEGKGNRYRLVYILTDKATTVSEFEKLVYSANIYLRTLYPGFLIDLNSKKCTQPMYGTDKNAAVYTSDCVYSKNDFLKYYDYNEVVKIDAEDKALRKAKKELAQQNKPVVTKKVYRKKGNKITKVITKGKNRGKKREYRVKDEEFVNEFFKLDLYDELSVSSFLAKYEERYPYFNETHLEASEDEMGIILPDDPEDYQKLFMKYRTYSVYDPKTGKRRIYSEIVKIGIGKRTRAMYVTSQLRRVMKKDVTPEHLLYCLLYDFTFLYDVSDKEIDNKKLYNAAFDAYYDEMCLTIQKDKRKFKVNEAYCKKYHLTKRTVANMFRRYLKDCEIALYYDFNLSVKENLVILHEAGVKVQKSRLYEFLNKYTEDNKKETESAANRSNKFTREIRPNENSERIFLESRDDIAIKQTNSNLNQNYLYHTNRQHKDLEFEEYQGDMFKDLSNSVCNYCSYSRCNEYN